MNKGEAEGEGGRKISSRLRADHGASHGAWSQDPDMT